jgi:hypothetical protein
MQTEEAKYTEDGRRIVGRLPRKLTPAELEARKAAQAAAKELAIAEQAHRQSRERLLAKHETAAEHNRRVFREMREEQEREALPNRYQAILDFWIGERLAAEAAERAFRAALDPCNLGLYGPRD